jgi:hypothetical protein
MTGPDAQAEGHAHWGELTPDDQTHPSPGGLEAPRRGSLGDMAMMRTVEMARLWLAALFICALALVVAGLADNRTITYALCQHDA